MAKSPAMGMECLLGDPTLEEKFRRFKKRDLTETYRFQKACGLLGQQKCSSSAFRKHIMDKRSIFPATHPQPTCHDARPAVPASGHRGAAAAQLFYTRFPEDKPAEHPDWISDRRAFRRALDGMGNLRKWLKNKPILSDLEVHITERDRRAKLISASFPPEASIFTPPQNDANSDHTLQRDVEQVKCFLRLREACSFSKLLDWNGTGKLKQADLFTRFKKEGFLIPPERMNVLMSALNSKDGDSVTVEDLAAAIHTWSRKHQEREELNSNPDNEQEISLGLHPKTHGEERNDQEGLQDVEVLAIMRRGLTSSRSAVSSFMGREVDHFRRLCFSEYLKSLEQCQRQGLNVSQTTLQRVLLHPSDLNLYSSSKLEGNAHLGCSEREQGLTLIRKPQTYQVQEGAHKRHRDTKKQSIGWADPNAFWPGKEDHVRLFLPVKTSSPAMVLFQRIERTVVPSPGHWPVNHLGYSTSGDIEARKIYNL
ncbi:uncharacterized protein si:dkey-197j19.5 [Danio aesculapii]|uniref:uncharacterized protein si:dkey-197j19.5 n=1 Tax=Danio aesculapii TaxID=1142201 RepID=UPI0024C0BCBE|nr:uncharacterized protein si:dkey-197j19.5 [Danio aesculapii]